MMWELTFLILISPFMVTIVLMNIIVAVGVWGATYANRSKRNNRRT